MGNCWLVAGVTAIARLENIFNRVVPSDQTSFDDEYFTGCILFYKYNGLIFMYTGCFHFRFWRLGQFYDVVVDDYLPFYSKPEQNSENDLVFCRSNKTPNLMWPCLLEKAYAKY